MAVVERDWAELAAAVGNRLIRPGDGRYEELRRPALPRYADVRPQAIVLARHERDVVEAVRFGQRTGLRLTPRSGGHDFAGRSSSGDVVVDLRWMDGVRVQPGLVEVAAGVRLGQLEQTLAAHDDVLPLGCGASVGVAGLALGGGIGLLGRRYGLTCDHLVRARVVLSDGQVVECDETRDGDLFWALRGAGRRVGVVTALRFRTVPRPTMTVFSLTWLPEQAAAAVQAWLRYAPAAPDVMTAELCLSSGGPGPGGLTVQAYGSVLAEQTDALPLLADLVGEVGAQPATRSVQAHGYSGAKQALQRMRSVGAPDHPDWPEYSRSEFFRRRLPAAACDGLVTNLTIDPPSPAVTRHVTLTPWAGAYNRVAAEETAFVHRNELFLVEHVAQIAPTARPDEVTAARSWLGRSYAGLRPWGSGGVYPNFTDPDLDDEARAYYGGNLDRLQQIGRTYQPVT